MRLRVSILSALIIILTLSGCGRSSGYRPIENVDDLQGRRVGVNMAWEADYILTGRTDLELYRYDTTADMLMALNFDKLDAIAADLITLKLVQSNVSGLEIVEPPMSQSGYCAYFIGDLTELSEDFNDFIRDFRARDSYATYCQRQEDFDGVHYQMPELPPNGDGQNIRVAVMDGEFPRAFFDPSTGEPMGFDVEVLRQWAGERGYHLDFTATNDEDMLLGLQSERYDMGIGYISTVYREDALEAGFLVSDSFVEIPAYFCQKSEQGIVINGDVD